MDANFSAPGADSADNHQQPRRDCDCQRVAKMFVFAIPEPPANSGVSAPREPYTPTHPLGDDWQRDMARAYMIDRLNDIIFVGSIVTACIFAAVLVVAIYSWRGF